MTNIKPNKLKIFLTQIYACVRDRTIVGQMHVNSVQYLGRTWAICSPVCSLSSAPSPAPSKIAWHTANRQASTGFWLFGFSGRENRVSNNLATIFGNRISWYSNGDRFELVARPCPPLLAPHCATVQSQSTRRTIHLWQIMPWLCLGSTRTGAMNGTNEANYSNGSAIASINRFRKPPLIDRTPETRLSLFSTILWLFLHILALGMKTNEFALERAETQIQNRGKKETNKKLNKQNFHSLARYLHRYCLSWWSADLEWSIISCLRGDGTCNMCLLRLPQHVHFSPQSSLIWLGERVHSLWAWSGALCVVRWQKVNCSFCCY